MYWFVKKTHFRHTVALAPENVAVRGLYMNNLINDGRSYVLQITSVYLYKLCRFTVTTALHCIGLEVSHKQNLYKVTGYKYILHFLYK